MFISLCITLTCTLCQIFNNSFALNTRRTFQILPFRLVAHLLKPKSTDGGNWLICLFHFLPLCPHSTSLHVLAINRACQSEITLGAVTHAVFNVYNTGPLARLAFHTSVMSLVQSDPLWLVLLTHKVQHPSSLVCVLTFLYCAQLHISPQAIILDTRAGDHQ